MRVCIRHSNNTLAVALSVWQLSYSFFLNYSTNVARLNYLKKQINNFNTEANSISLLQSLRISNNFIFNISPTNNGAGFSMPMGIVIRRSSFIMNLDLMRLQNNKSEVQTLNIFCVKYNRKAIGKITSICDIIFFLFGSTVFQQLLHQFSSHDQYLERQILDFRFNSWFWSHLILRLKIHYQGPICFHDNHSNIESNWINLLPYFFFHVFTLEVVSYIML